MGTDRTYLADTNILFDYCDPARPEHQLAVQLVEGAAASPDIHLCTLVSSLKDVYYVLGHLYKDEQKARRAVQLLMENCFEVIDLLAAYGFGAVRSDEPVFEDGLVRMAAESLRVDAIISRDERAFAKSPVRKLSLQEAVGELCG